MGLGEVLDRAQATALSAGDYHLLPVGTPHFAWASEETVIQVHSDGAWGIAYVDPAEDPRNQSYGFRLIPYHREKRSMIVHTLHPYDCSFSHPLARFIAVAIKRGNATLLGRLAKLLSFTRKEPNMNFERPEKPQHYLCPGEHGTWFVRQDALTLEWLLGQDPRHTSFRIAASVPICALCGSTLVEVATLEAWLDEKMTA